MCEAHPRLPSWLPQPQIIVLMSHPPVRSSPGCPQGYHSLPLVVLVLTLVWGSPLAVFMAATASVYCPDVSPSCEFPPWLSSWLPQPHIVVLVSTLVRGSPLAILMAATASVPLPDAHPPMRLSPGLSSRLPLPHLVVLVLTPVWCSPLDVLTGTTASVCAHPPVRFTLWLSSQMLLVLP